MLGWGRAAALFGLALGTGVTTAQVDSGGKMSGEIVMEGEARPGFRFAGWVVELRQIGSARVPARSAVDAGGSFEFAGLAPGGFQLDVIDPAGRVVRSEMAWVQPGAAAALRVVIRQEANRAGGSISLKRLVHKPGKTARREYEAAMKLIERNDQRGALLRLEKSAASDPDFYEARFQLGLMLAREERAAEALPHLEAAAAIDSSQLELHVTLAWALLALGRFADAERAASEALQRDRGSKAGHYLMGLARLGQTKLDAVTLNHLERASGKFPRAREAAAWLRENHSKQ